MSVSSDVPSSRKPSLEMRRSRSSSSLNDTQSGSMLRSVNATPVFCLAPLRFRPFRRHSERRDDELVSRSKPTELVEDEKRQASEKLSYKRAPIGFRALPLCEAQR